VDRNQLQNPTKGPRIHPATLFW